MRKSKALRYKELAITELTGGQTYGACGTQLKIISNERWQYKELAIKRLKVGQTYSASGVKLKFLDLRNGASGARIIEASRRLVSGNRFTMQAHGVGYQLFVKV